MCPVNEWLTSVSHPDSWLIIMEIVTLHIARNGRITLFLAAFQMGDTKIDLCSAMGFYAHPSAIYGLVRPAILHRETMLCDGRMK